MRRLLQWFAGIVVMSAGLGCHHTAGVCDCEPHGCGTAAGCAGCSAHSTPTMKPVAEPARDMPRSLDK